MIVTKYPRVSKRVSYSAECAAVVAALAIKFTSLQRLPTCSLSDYDNQESKPLCGDVSIGSAIVTTASGSIRIPKDDRINNLSGRSIEVVVGLEPPIPFSVHENLICASSDFFRKAMEGDWKESKQLLVCLEDDDPDTFLVYLHWLYRGTLPVRIDEPGPLMNSEYLQLAKAYILGDKLQDGDFKDVVIDAMIDKCKSTASDGHRWFPVGPVLRCMYKNTPTSSKARRLLVDIYVHHGPGHWTSDGAEQDEIPKDFLYEVTMAFMDKRDKNEEDPTQRPTCAYHEHGPGETRCYKARLRNGIVTRKAQS
ncbi:uncharacterized protein EI97DRAFT_412463 [Westerdykella ornata]|uniref:BTB domain-containing protein n=1 Tax=Westerdykella ornata TaxID=318751 RepID=A0A6A6JTJ4_WESOR|nr:uncharacterized protein EI97DRAFT_412463 [Westerdykella ornata]KAF2279433.1 hypothetical protein EI97DRAFT_412463 [Westerdykella ornata]